MWIITYLHWAFQCFLYVQPLPGNCCIQFSLKCQQVHIGLRLWHEISNLKSTINSMKSKTNLINYKPPLDNNCNADTVLDGQTNIKLHRHRDSYISFPQVGSTKTWSGWTDRLATKVIPILPLLHFMYKEENFRDCRIFFDLTPSSIWNQFTVYF